MFCFTLDDLKITLSNLTPEIRRSLYGLYKHKEYENLGNYLVKNSLGYFVGCRVHLNYPFDKIEIVLRNLNKIVRCQHSIVYPLLNSTTIVKSYNLLCMDTISSLEWANLHTEVLNYNVGKIPIERHLLLFELDKLIKFIESTDSIKAYCEECRVHKVKVDLACKIATTKSLPKVIKEHLISLI